MSLFHEKRLIRIVVNDEECEVEALLQEIDNRVCRLTIILPNEIINIEAQSFFDCLSMMKNTHPNILIKCKGYKVNVYPSRMAMQMSSGLVAYELEMGRQAKGSDIVHIFDFESDNLSTSNDEQKNFYQEWLNSFS